MEFNATFLVSIISFLVFMKIMNAIFYIPLTDLIQARENFVKENNQCALEATKQAEELLKDKNEKLSQAAKDSRQILIDKTNEANLNFQTKVNEAKNNANQRVEELKNELIKSGDDARISLNAKIEELAQQIIDKVLTGGKDA